MSLFLNKIKNMFIYCGLCFKFKRLRRRDEMSFVVINTTKMLIDVVLVEKALVKSGYKQWRPYSWHHQIRDDYIIYINSDVDYDTFYNYIESLRSNETFYADDTLYTTYRV